MIKTVWRVMVIVLPCLGLAIGFTLSMPNGCHALCATVKIEIKQELTLERQAFDAHMRINNGLSHVTIDNVSAVVHFFDAEGNPVQASFNPGDTSASFFIRLDRMENIEAVDGTGSVAPDTSADIHWLIIPSAGASNGLESGTLYFVGATLTYVAGGQSETITVTPDHIFVKPMPQLVLDYFLPSDIYGDDPHSPNIEPPIPFSLGLRAGNRGYGHARSLKIESARPRIVANETGVLVAFRIEGSKINGKPSTDNLLVDFGNIAPNSASVASWTMSCPLSGRFVDFGAEFSHADELGGKLTSMIAQEDVRTHLLVRSVLVDAQGRDGIEDFLALDDDVYRVYESDNVDTIVIDQTAEAGLTPHGGRYQLSIPPTEGFMFARVTDPANGSLLIKEAIRSDGKCIKPANVWLSKTRAGSGPWQYFLNIFDHNTPGGYAIEFQSAAQAPQPPVIMFMPERTGIEGQTLSFVVEATDPNGTIPTIDAAQLPIGAVLMDNGDGSAVFTWTPVAGQAGRYVLRFIASDGVLESSRQVVIRIFRLQDSDGDGMLDSWELTHFGTLDRDGSGDSDGDGITDLEEFNNGFDPGKSQSAPSVPEIIHPEVGMHVDHLTPELIVSNSSDSEGDTITYTFEIFSDDAFKDMLCTAVGVAAQTGTTAWTAVPVLADNTWYNWRVQAADTDGSSNWVYGRFFTDTANDPPSAPGISHPADGCDVDTRQPILEITNALDLEEDPITYVFEIYSDSTMSELVASAQNVAPGADHTTAWTVNTVLSEGVLYFWRAVAVDSRGAVAPGPMASFKVNTVNSAPQVPTIAAPLPRQEITAGRVDLSIYNAVDPDGNQVAYIFERDTDPAFNGTEKIVSGYMAPMEPDTVWFNEALMDNTWYFWRVKSSDGAVESPWVTGSFFVNTLNEAPSTPELRNPAIGAWVNTQTPALSVHPVQDVDQDVISYRFEIYADEALSTPVDYMLCNEPAWTGVAPLKAGRWYFWRVQAVDEHGIPGEWSETGAFFVKINGIDQPPQLTFLSPAQDIYTNAQDITIRWNDRDPDSSALISLYYDTDDTGADGVLIAEGIAEDPDGADDYYVWDTSGLEGTFHIYAVISDAVSSATFYCPVSVTIDRTPPVVTVQPDGGTFLVPVEVTLSVDESAAVYYTLDGSLPDTAAAVYDQALVISQDTTLWFMGVDTAGNRSAAGSATYRFDAADVTVTAVSDKGRPLSGIRIYAFTGSGRYTGTFAVTAGDGSAHFDPERFAAGDYRFRVDYLGNQFWSEIIAAPVIGVVTVVIPEEAVTVAVQTASGAAQGVKVYLFSANRTYLGLHAFTDTEGLAVFHLPAGMTYNFRADLYGSQFWSDPATVDAGLPSSVPVEAGGGRLSAIISKAPEQPLSGVRVYLFNSSGAYLGHSATTDASGRVGFDVPSGDYRLRVDYLGYQFWSDDTAVTTDTAIAVLLPHQSVQVRVEERFERAVWPAAAVNVYLFSEAGSYLGRMQSTDDQGCVNFELPEKPFKIRADYLGRQYWSATFTWQDSVVAIPIAQASVTVTGAGYPLADVRVYLFTPANSYLGRYLKTDAQGQCLFELPEGGYRFRADYQGSQHWSAVENLVADQRHDIGLSTGGGTFTFTLLSAAEQPLSGINAYLFNGNGNYLGLFGTTDTDGRLFFDLSDGTYQLRADHLGCQFWSEPVQVPDTFQSQMNIVHTPVDVHVMTAAGPVEAARVYLFTGQGAYLGRHLESDALGCAGFDLPAGATYVFRADLLGSQYWSEPLVVPEHSSVEVEIDAGGGNLQVLVQDGTGAPMADLRAYLYSGGDRYLGYQSATDAAGGVSFNVAQGEYKVRVDYLGYSYWTDTISLAYDRLIVLPIVHHPVTVNVEGLFQEDITPLAGVRMFLFTSTGTYLGQYRETDVNGEATFSLPEQAYQVRADYLGQQYWSNTLNQADQTITIPMADAVVHVTGAGLPRQGIRAYVYSSSDAFLGISAVTDQYGHMSVRLPAGTYRFRADYQGNQYWSGLRVLEADHANPLVVSVGGGTFRLHVGQDDGTPMAGLNCYVYNAADHYLGLLGATNDQGEVSFDLADGPFKFRIDYLGYTYWSQTITVPDVLQADVAIAHMDIAIRLTASYLGSPEPLGGQRFYLFTPTGKYLAVSHITDEQGQAVLRLPDREYRVRADYLGRQYWSEAFRGQNTSIDIPHGAVDMHVHRDQWGLPGVRVYLFTPTGTYLGRFMVTDADGWVALILPEATYRLRADVEAIQHWTSDITVSAGQTAAVEIEVP